MSHEPKVHPLRPAGVTRIEPPPSPAPATAAEPEGKPADDGKPKARRAKE